MTQVLDRSSGVRSWGARTGAGGAMGWLGRVCLLACVVGVVGTGSGVYGAANTLSQVAARGEYSSPPPPESTRQFGRLIDFEFKGGTFGELVEQLVAATEPTPLNIVMPDSVLSVPVSAMSLRQAAPLAILYAVSTSITTPDRSIRIQYDDRVIRDISVPDQVPIITVIFFERAPQATIPGVGVAALASASRPTTGPAQIVSVFSLGSIYAEAAELGVRLSADDVLGPLELGLSLGHEESQPRPELTLHADSRLLFVRGSVEQIQFVTRILEQFMESIHNRVDLETEDARPRIVDDELKHLLAERSKVASELEQRISIYLKQAREPNSHVHQQNSLQQFRSNLETSQHSLAAIDEQIALRAPDFYRNWVEVTIPRAKLGDWTRTWFEYIRVFEGMSEGRVRLTPGVESFKVAGRTQDIRNLWHGHGLLLRVLSGDPEKFPPPYEPMPLFH